VASSLLGTLLVWGLIGGDLTDSQEYTYSTIAQTAFLGVAWFFSTALFAERFENRLIKSSILGLSIVAILGVHFDLHYPVSGIG
jgi:ABC-type enterochelin transport system permease subunit